MYSDQATVERDLGYAKRINLNSTRIWLSYKAYEKDPQGYIDRLRNYIRTSQQLGFTTMPILFNGNGLDPETLKPAFHSEGDAYVKAIVGAVKDEPGLLMWDVMNEPLWNDYYNNATGEEKQQHADEIYAFVRYYLKYVKQIDPVNATTAGYAFSSQIEPTADLVDVLSFHDYTPTRASVENAYSTAEAVAKKFGKPILNTETGCIARANPYDMVLEIANEHKTGWYLFNLMIGGYWGEIHGCSIQMGRFATPRRLEPSWGST
jgi:endo-1,4-beta-mannosidase